MAFSRSFHAQLLKQTFPRRPLAASSLRPTRQLLSKRCNSSTTPESQLQSQSQSQESTRSRSLRNLLYIAIFGGLGLSLGSRIEKLIATPPEPDTEEDLELRRSIESAYERLPIVQAMRDDPDFEKEWTAYSNFSDEEKEHRLTSGPLKGGRGLAMQKIFYNAKENSIVNVVYFGAALEGWPTVVHGGALATVLDETLGRVAVRSFPARTGVTANLNINYRAPVSSVNFYTITATLDPILSTDRKAHIKAEVRDQTGKLCVEATALFVVPRNLPLRTIGDGF
ncbi:thioesterase family protein [Paecilomyces variotii No. 5]|uniref:Thioesterase family protein n=1 Tax=Byssochlamys spectabilis (strain No. 5 / NBRC 109023) TaxID=1356009 RepID=V5GAE8_BYSSN|nr:thioesterase family protein [Paecilomyces variotii No. 5]